MAILYGFFSGAYVSLLPSIFAAFAKSPIEIGARLGLGTALSGVGALLGTPFAGFALGSDVQNPRWYAGSVLCGGSILIGTMFFTLARAGLAKQKGTQKI